MRALSSALSLRSLATFGGLSVIGCGLLWWTNTIPAVDLAPSSASDWRSPRSAVLAVARRTTQENALDAFVREQAERCAKADASAEDWRILGEAHLECVLQMTSVKGMAVARPSFPKPPATLLAHLDAGERAIERARALGDQHSETARIEAGLKSNRIVGIASALRLGSEVDRLIGEAAERDQGNPHVAVARGCRLVFAPRFLGGDPQAALMLFEQAAEAMPDDERPLVFAAFAAHVVGDAGLARKHIHAAARRNPANRYAAEVSGRLERGEADPFGRDVTP